MVHASRPWPNAVMAVLFLYSPSLAATGHCHLHCAVLGCTTGTRCFLLPPLTSVAPRVPPGTIQRGAQNITEQCFTRFSYAQGPNVSAAMLFREALA